MTLPNFMIIGAGKAGTTSLYAYAAQHPEIYMSPLKETNYFVCYGVKPRYRGPGDNTLVNRTAIYLRSDYERLFAGVNGEKAVGEASPRYLSVPDVAARIRRDLPHCRLIAGLRHPVERAFASYVWNAMSGRDPCATFESAIEQEPVRCAAGWYWGDYMGRGYYYEQLKRYYDLFPAAQIKVYLYEDLTRDAIGLMQELFRFLGVSDSFRPDVGKRHNLSGSLPNPVVRRIWNASRPLRDWIRPLWPASVRERAFERVTRGAQKLALDPELRRQLTLQYRDDILRVQDLIQRDLSAWLRA